MGIPYLEMVSLSLRERDHWRDPDIDGWILGGMFRK
jgi:hypothetical protein